MPEHLLDHDATCIHCGLDACDIPRGERLPPCPVWHEETRAANVQAFAEQLDERLDALWDERCA